MNQIPNIEEWKKLARKKLAPNVTYIDPKFKEVASWAEELLNAFWVEQQKDLDAFIDTIHHQLQKAREEERGRILQIVNDVELSYAVNDGRDTSEMFGGQMAACEIRRQIRNIKI